MIRGYATSALFREDTIERIKHLNAEIADLQKSMGKTKKEVAASERRIQKLKKELGIID
ncbi:MAG: hypothetical protein IH857_06265 [Deltaproteobacteria bacterium]|nr:hypothetical protein [Deltaproteobacteria bacterium]